MSKQSAKTQQEKAKKLQPLSAISIQDLNSVQLRRTEKVVASKVRFYFFDFHKHLNFFVI